MPVRFRFSILNTTYISLIHKDLDELLPVRCHSIVGSYFGPKNKVIF